MQAVASNKLKQQRIEVVRIIHVCTMARVANAVVFAGWLVLVPCLGHLTHQGKIMITDHNVQRVTLRLKYWPQYFIHARQSL